MKLKWLAILLFNLAGCVLLAQPKNVLGYRIEGDSVVFTFNAADYSKYTDESNGERVDFDDFNIEEVALSGDFNMWSRDKWIMKKVNDNIYELRKKLTDFTDQFSWEFKFVINGTYWAEPYKETSNTTPAVDENGQNLHVYNLRVYTARASEDGNTTFKLKGFPNAKEVVLTGSFNRWDEHLFKMHQTDDGWIITLQINPGEYEYKFIVDGNWMEDPNNPAKRINEYGGYNSIINVKIPVVFKLHGYQDAKKVVLSGSFNGWNEKELKMTKVDDGWEIAILLSGGKHHYKYIVDNEWMVDPDNTVKEFDGHGNINSVKMVK